jgi:hypothetical protein
VSVKTKENSKQKPTKWYKAERKPPTRSYTNNQFLYINQYGIKVATNSVWLSIMVRRGNRVKSTVLAP